MKRIFLLSLAALMMTIACTRVPITNRNQLNLLPEDQLMTMADTQYRQFLAQSKVLPKSDPRAQQVERVGRKIQMAVEKFMSSKGMSERIKDYKWEFNTVDDKTVNAWCMPGGKVVVYTGILPLASDEDMLAVIMGHEIAHAIARHGNERMSNIMAAQGVGNVLAVLMGSNPTTGQQIFMQAYGISSQLGILKYSRVNETEADKMGLVFMRLAGYDVNKAITFWGKMAAMGGEAPPEFLSTHPSDQTRIDDIKEFIPQIEKYIK